MNILIVTIENDIHACAVKHEIDQVEDVNCHIFALDKVSSSYAIHWCPESAERSTLTGPDIGKLAISEIDVIWWRRSRSEQNLDLNYSDKAHIDLINNDCRASSFGLLLSHFKGKWISSPNSTLEASNKLFQLRRAHESGLKIPKTIISNEPEEVYRFIKNVGSVVVKAVSGTKEKLVFTRPVNIEDLNDESIRACPTIYQEYIEGDQHLRICTIGEKSFATKITTEEIDWRRNVNVDYNATEVPRKLHIKIRQVLDSLNLEMGMTDVKINFDGEPVWLEVNPQGQFLFAEGLTNIPLRKYFANYLVEEARGIRSNKSTVDKKVEVI